MPKIKRATFVFERCSDRSERSGPSKPTSACPNVFPSEGHNKSGASARLVLKRDPDGARKTPVRDVGGRQDGKLQGPRLLYVGTAPERDAIQFSPREGLFGRAFRSRSTNNFEMRESRMFEVFMSMFTTESDSPGVVFWDASWVRHLKSPRYSYTPTAPSDHHGVCAKLGTIMAVWPCIGIMGFR